MAIRVLHVDDDPNFTRLTRAFLERAMDDIAVTAVSGGPAALERLAQSSFDCIVSDYNMPEMDGITLLEEVRRRYPDLPVILFTGKGSEEVASDAISAGVTDYLQKGSGTEQYDLLANRIEHAVDASAAKRRSERRKREYRTLLEVTPAPIVVADRDLDIRYCNSSAGETFGVADSADLTGEPASTFLHPDDAGAQLDRIEGVLRAEGPATQQEFRIQTASGETRHVNGTVATATYEGDRCALMAFVDVTERTENERQLERERERFSAIFEQFPEPTIAYRYDGGDRPIVSDVNESFEEVFGVEAETAVDQPIDDLIVPPAFEDEALQLDERVRSGERVDAEVRRRTSSGDRHFSFRNIPVPDDQPIDGFGVYTDIDERKERTERLERYRTQVEAAGDPMYILDEEGVVEFINEALVDYLDTPRAEVVGSHVSRMLADGEFEEASAVLAAVLEDPERSSGLGEFTIRTDDGRTLLAEINLVPLTDDDGAFIGTVGSVRDVSKRKRRERALESLHDVATALQSTNTVEGVCTRTVEAADETLELSLSTVLIREGEQLVPYARSDDTDPEGVLPMAISDGIAGETYRTGETTVEDDVHENENANVARDAYRAGMSIPIGKHGVFQAVSTTPEAFDSLDIEFAELLVSHAKAALDSIARLDDLERKNEHLEEFANIVSHDLRTPLTVASGHLELARSADDSEHLAEVETSHERIESLIGDLLALAKQGEYVSEVGAVDLGDLVESCWQSVETNSATLRIEASANVSADRERLRQLVENLLQNAVKHGGSAATVTVGAHPRKGTFFVEDDGPGIPADDRDRVFEFGMTSASDGTGYGLPIVARIADDHGWDVTVTDGTAGGARFEFTGVEFP